MSSIAQGLPVLSHSATSPSPSNVSFMWTPSEWIALASLLLAALTIGGNIVRDRWRFAHERTLQKDRFAEERGARNRETAYLRLTEIEPLLRVKIPGYGHKDPSEVMLIGSLMEGVLSEYSVTNLAWRYEDEEDREGAAAFLVLVKADLDGMAGRLRAAHDSLAWIRYNGWTPAVRDSADKVNALLQEFDMQRISVLEAVKTAIRWVSRDNSATSPTEMSDRITDSWVAFHQLRKALEEALRELADRIRDE